MAQRPLQTRYLAKSGPVTFAPGETQKSFVVTIVNDFQPGPDVTFGVTVANPTTGTLGPSAAPR